MGTSETFIGSAILRYRRRMVGLTRPAGSLQLALRHRGSAAHEAIAPRAEPLYERG